MRGARSVLASTAVILGVLAAFAGRPQPDGALPRHTASSLEPVRRVDALELARWIRSRRTALHLIDLRLQNEFDDAHLPGARRLAASSLPAEHFMSGETIVLVANEEEREASAAGTVETAADVWVLAGGVGSWSDEVLNPVLPADASASQRQSFAEIAELSRYFGGAPRVEVASAADVRTRPADHAGRARAPRPAPVKPTWTMTRRRGC